MPAAGLMEMVPDLDNQPKKDLMEVFILLTEPLLLGEPSDFLRTKSEAKNAFRLLAWTNDISGSSPSQFLNNRRSCR